MCICKQGKDASLFTCSHSVTWKNCPFFIIYSKTIKYLKYFSFCWGKYFFFVLPARPVYLWGVKFNISQTICALYEHGIKYINITLIIWSQEAGTQSLMKRLSMILAVSWSWWSSSEWQPWAQKFIHFKNVDWKSGVFKG